MKFNNISYRLVRKLAAKLSKYVSIREKDFVKRETEDWYKIFKNEKSFTHKLSNNIKINLYSDSILSQLIYNGFEELELDFLKANLSSGDIFLDIGSNIGLFSLVASQRVGDAGLVVAYEPNPVTYSRLIENIKINNFDNIQTHNIGLSNLKSDLDFYISKNGYDAWNSFAPEPSKLQEMIKVPVSTLDSLVKELDVEKIKVIKIDVEGWEKFVLQGGQQFLTKFSPLLIVEFGEANALNANYYVQELFAILEDMGYNWYDIQSDLSLLPHRKKLAYPYSNLIAKKV